MIKNLLILILATASVCSYAQQPMSLSEAQEYALSNNLTVRNTQIDLDKAIQKVWETTADGLPQIAASGSYQHTLSELPEVEFEPGKKIALGVRNSYTGAATLNQLLFNGSYFVGLRASKAYRNFAELGIEKSTIEIRAAVAQSYYLCLLSAESSVILDENLELLKKTLIEMRAMKEQGLVDRTSLDQIEVAYNQLTAQCNSSRRQIKTSSDMLKYIIGMPMSDQIVLSDKLADIIGSLDASYLTPDLYEPSEHIDIKLAAMNVTLDGLKVQLAKTAYMPSLGAQVGVSHNFSLPDFSFQNATTAYVGVSLQMPLFTSGKTHAQVRQAKMTLEQSRNSAELARQSLDLEFSQAQDAFLLAIDNHEVQKKNFKLAARVLDDMKKSISVGMKSSTDLIQANASYLEAVSSMISSELTLLNSKTRIDKILNN